MQFNNFNDILTKVSLVMEQYKKEYPDVRVDRDYLPFKIGEEWGECLQTYLMLTDRGRQKDKTKQEIKEMFAEEYADILAYLLLFAQQEGIDPVNALEKKWFKYLE